MEYVVFALILLFIVWLFRRSPDDKYESASKSERVFLDNKKWLEERWNSINNESKSLVEAWYFDKPTVRQIARLEEEGLVVKDKTLIKGQISDLIGLYVKPEEHEKEILKFFKVPLKGMHQTKARHEIGLLFEDSEKKEAWDNRPANTIDKEFYRFVGKPVPKNVTHVQAMRDQSESDLPEDTEYEWDLYTSAWDELSDRETREEYDLKKPSLAKFREAWKALREEIEDIDDLSDPGLIAEKLIELYPDLQRD